MRELTVRVRLEVEWDLVAAPGLEPSDPVVHRDHQDVPPFGRTRHHRTQKLGPCTWDLVFDFVPTTEVGRYLLHCLRTGTGQVRLTNSPPFAEAEVTFEFNAPKWLYEKYPDLFDAIRQGRWVVGDEPERTCLA